MPWREAMATSEVNTSLSFLPRVGFTAVRLAKLLVDLVINTCSSRMFACDSFEALACGIVPGRFVGGYRNLSDLMAEDFRQI